MKDDPRTRGEKQAEQTARANDNRLLREMVGNKCANMQIQSLRFYDRPQVKRQSK